MIILLAILAIMAIGLWISFTQSGIEGLGVVITIIFGIYLLVHVIRWSTATYSYNITVVERNSFVETLNDARNNKRELESAAILKEISEWNRYLAEAQYDNGTFLLGDYHDDRIMNLKPIR